MATETTRIRFAPVMGIVVAVAGGFVFWLVADHLMDETSSPHAQKNPMDTKSRIATNDEISRDHPIESKALSPEALLARPLPGSTAQADSVGRISVGLNKDGQESMTPSTIPENADGYVERSAKREWNIGIPELFRRDTSPRPTEWDFPLFDDQVVTLTALRHQSMGEASGVVSAKAEGEPNGGHVVLSYVGTALAGTIHLPSRGEFYEIRTGPNGKSHILSQLDPARMPSCGVCAEHAIE